MTKTEKIILKIQGMHCAHCALTIEKILSKQKGVVSANVNFTLGHCVIEYEPEKISLNELKKTVKTAGYKVEEKTKDDVQTLKFLFIFGLILTIPIIYIHKFLELQNETLILFFLTTPIQFIVGSHFYRGAYYSLKNKSPNLDLLVVLSTSAAYFYSLCSTFIFPGLCFYEASATIITTITCGKLLESLSKTRASESIKKLISLQPNTARIIKDEKEIEISVSNLNINDIVIVKPGERIPADGTVLEGYSFVDESMLTGESMPVEKKPDRKIFAGTINKNGILKFNVEKATENTILMQIVKLVEQSQKSKLPIQRIADKITNYFVPLVAVISIITFLTWYFLFNAEFTFALTASMAVLVVACPCAIGLAVPIAIFVGYSSSAEQGILIKSGEYLEKICELNTIVFDKTGTITKGELKVTDVFGENEILKYGAIAERYSEHPIGKAIFQYASPKTEDVNDFQAISGGGVIAKYNDEEILIGNKFLMDQYKVNIEEKFEKELSRLVYEGKTVVLVAVNRKILGLIAVADILKPDISETISEIKSLGLDIMMLTGDNERVAKGIANKIGISNTLANVLPDAKLIEIKKLQQQGRIVAMVGDGINDAPALTQSDVGFAISSGTDIAMESGDVILMKENLNDINWIIKFSKKTMNKIKQNLVAAFFYNIIAIPFAAGVFYSLTHTLVHPTFAAIAMVVSNVVVICNSLLLKNIKID